MKKNSTFLLILALLVHATLSFAQTDETKEKKLSTFRFYPFQLITSSLAFGKETFSEDKTRSTVLQLGVRYKNWEGTDYNAPPLGQNAINQYNSWKGITVGVERRFYVPSFRTRENGTLVDRNGSFGVYFAPGLRVDYNQRDYDNSTYSYIYDNNTGKQTGPNYIENKGKINYLGIMPYMNLGIQFTVFQYMYIDIYAGGGLRFLEENIVSKSTNSSQNNGYFSGNGSGAIEEFIPNKGVQPNIGMAIGLKW